MNFRANSLILPAALALVVLSAATGPARAQTGLDRESGTAAENTDRPSGTDGKELPPRGRGGQSGVEDRQVGGKGEDEWRIGGYLKTLLALGLVVLLIFLARLLLRRFGGAAKAPRRHGPIEVLSRTTVAPKQQFLLVRVGERLVLVGAGPGGFATLSEITDPEEIAALMKTLEASREGSFGGIFKRKAEQLARAVGAQKEGNLTGSAQNLTDVTGEMQSVISDEKDEQ